MADAGVGRHHPQPIERLLAPPQEPVPFPVAFELQPGVHVERVRGAEPVDDHRVVDHQLGRHLRVHLRRIPAEGCDRVPHGGKIDNGGHPGEVLHENPSGGEGDLIVRLGGGVPRGQPLDVRLGDRNTVLVAEEVLQQNLQRIGQVLHAEAVEGRQCEDRVLPVADCEVATAAEGVVAHDQPL